MCSGVALGARPGAQRPIGVHHAVVQGRQPKRRDGAVGFALGSDPVAVGDPLVDQQPGRVLGVADFVAEVVPANVAVHAPRQVEDPRGDAAAGFAPAARHQLHDGIALLRPLTRRWAAVLPVVRPFWRVAPAVALDDERVGAVRSGGGRRRKGDDRAPAACRRSSSGGGRLRPVLSRPHDTRARRPVAPRMDRLALHRVRGEHAVSTAPDARRSATPRTPSHEPLLDRHILMRASSAEATPPRVRRHQPSSPDDVRKPCHMTSEPRPFFKSFIS